MSLLGESKAECGPIRSPKSCQAKNKNTKPKPDNKNKHKQKQKQKPTKDSERTDKTALKGLAAYVPMNYEILHSNKQTPDHGARSCEGVQQNKPLSSAETQDPPCQDPGDRAEKPSRHKTSSQLHAAMQ